MKIAEKIIILIIVSLCLNLPVLVAATIDDKRVDIGKKLLDRFEFEKAVDYFREFARKESAKDYFHYYLAESIRLRLFYARYKEFNKNEEIELISESEKFFKSCLSLNPHFIDARIGLGKLYLFNKNYEKALNVFLVIEKIGVADWGVYSDIATAYNKLNKSELSKTYRALSSNDQNVLLHKENDIQIERKDKIKIGKHLYSIHSQILWSIMDVNTFLSNYTNHRIFEDLIYDIYIGSLITEANLCFHDMQIDMNDEFKIKLLKRINGIELSSRGVIVTNIKIDVRGVSGVKP